MRRLIGVALMVDGAWTLLWFSGLIAGLAWRSWWSSGLILCRAAAAGLAVTGGWLVTQRRAPGTAMAGWAWTMTTVVEAAAAVAGGLPINYDPVWRWPMVGGYAVAAGVVWLWRQRVRRQDGDDI